MYLKNTTLIQNLSKINYNGKMKIFKNFILPKKFKNCILAIGNFDGVHKGHQKVLKASKLLAKKNKLKFGVMTFEPIPHIYFTKIKNYRVNSLNQKIEFLKAQKLDFLIIKKFDKKFRNLSYKDFLKKIIQKKINTKYVFVSKNFKFGKNRLGNTLKMKNLENNLKFKTIVTKPLKLENKIISSTKIRKLISFGKIKKVKKYLGRSWELEGIVMKGFQRGRKIGFPTCNINLNNYIVPKNGVYAVSVTCKRVFYNRKGIANIGYRPTFNGKNLLLEVNIFGLSKNLYNKKLEIKFKDFIRPEKKFKSVVELKKQIKIDIKKCKKK
tara:strand:+ start:1979 stop:2953 length:975 start_codon:yes stop_codon:yes gene_type:complete